MTHPALLAEQAKDRAAFQRAARHAAPKAYTSEPDATAGSGGVMLGALLKALVVRADKVGFFTDEGGIVHPIRGSEGYTETGRGEGGGGGGSGSSAGAAPEPPPPEPTPPPLDPAREVSKLAAAEAAAYGMKAIYETSVGEGTVRLGISGNGKDRPEQADRALKMVGDLASRYPAVGAACQAAGGDLRVRVLGVREAQQEFRVSNRALAFMAGRAEGGLQRPTIYLKQTAEEWTGSKTTTEAERAKIDNPTTIGTRVNYAGETVPTKSETFTFGGNSIEATMSHEFGHMVDYSTNGNGAATREAYSEILKGPANGGTPDAQGLYPRDYMSTYGKSSPREAYAEAFSAYHTTGGQTSNPVVQAYASRFGWNASGMGERGMAAGS